MRGKAGLWLLFWCCGLLLAATACFQQQEATIEYRGQCEAKLAGDWVFEANNRNLKWQVQNVGSLTARFDMNGKEVVFRLGENKQEKETFKVVQCTEDVIFLEKTTKPGKGKADDPASGASQTGSDSLKKNIMTVVFKDKSEIELHVNDNELTFVRPLDDPKKKASRDKMKK